MGDPRLCPSLAARRDPQGAPAPRRTNATGPRRGPATAPAHLRPPSLPRFVLTPSCSSDSHAYGRACRPLAQGGTKRPLPSPSKMGASGEHSACLLCLRINGLLAAVLGGKEEQSKQRVFTPFCGCMERKVSVFRLGGYIFYCFKTEFLNY